jgi:uncharacterized delta-60 repeat protein
VITDLGLTAAGQAKLGTPRAVIVLGNGDILVGGDTGVVRPRPTGSLDTTFGSGGFAAVGFPGGPAGIPNLTVQPDGKILWVGAATNTSGGGNLSDFALERFTANGTPDKTFGRKGLVTLDMPAGVEGGEAFNAAAVQPDGKIVAVGSVGTGGRTGHSNVVLARYHPGGTPDTSFGSGGTVIGGPGGAVALGLDAASDIFTLPAYAEFSPSGQAAASVTPAAITASSHGGAAAFLPSGQFVIATALGVARHDVDVQVQRVNAGGSVASTSPSFDYSGASGLDPARDTAARWPSRPTAARSPADRISSAPPSSAWRVSTPAGASTRRSATPAPSPPASRVATQPEHSSSSPHSGHGDRAVTA